MAVAAGLVRLFRGAPQQPVGPDGKMPLADHLRELRARILRSVSVLVVAIIVALFFYDELSDLVSGPYEQAVGNIDVDSELIISGVGGPLLLQLKLSAIAAVIATSPYWLYQIWAFVMPGLHQHERRWTRVFSAVAGPLFIGGVAVGYYVLPKGLQVLIDFTPLGVTNLVDFDTYLSFFIRLLLVFGIAFEIPLFIVMLSLARVLSARTLAEYRAWIIVGTFVFAAVATPSTDPFTMLFLAIPMVVLIFVSEGIVRLIERRRRANDDTTDWDDDEASPLDETPSRIDDEADW
ncbi:twin-arginine translocase subunit TatC [Nocardioides massiliensis]|uniref:Sec-independent protein translocase protein TatC n=1 Tax=Nocardioides massiliensis TaxID=1325935 RepID=A0ABT9NRG2_9ACTN|nr:twin-arginine translocase subunit TatC [Nocardioides massiliensis]MDP9823015.1 sec-independent protein translocase protein TatC [Nocardioides massiliensis]